MTNGASSGARRFIVRGATCWLRANWRRAISGCIAAMALAVLGAVAIWLVEPRPALAWNDEGHMAVAYLAYQRMQPGTRRRVDSLLKRNPYYSRWLAAIPRGTPLADVQRMIFMIAATWPDEIRGDPLYVDDGASNGNLPDGGDSSRNIGYADHFRHKYWHFIDIPYSEDGTPLPPIPTPNAETQIAAFRLAIRSGESEDVKSYDLVWLEHLVGDVHQPLHAITRVSRSLPEGDAGGNRVWLCSAPCRDELHAFWDRLIGSQASISPPPPPNFGQPGVLAMEVKSAALAAMTLPAPDARRAANGSEAAWVQESFEAAQRYVYVAPIGLGTGPFQITQKYFDVAKSVAGQRVALAGARLARLLDQELK